MIIVLWKKVFIVLFFVEWDIHSFNEFYCEDYEKVMN